MNTMEEEVKSELNVGIDVALTAQKIFTQASCALSQLDVNACFHISGDFLRHLSTYMDDTEKSVFNQRWLALGTVINQYMIQSRSGSRIGIQPQLINDLHIFLQDLRTIFAKSGMMTKLAEDARKALR